MEPSYQDEPLEGDWFTRFPALHENIWGVSRSEVEARITRIPVLELLLVHKPDDTWEARLPQVQLNFAGGGRSAEEAVENLMRLFGTSSEHIESHPLIKFRPSVRAIEYLKRSLPEELRSTDKPDE